MMKKIERITLSDTLEKIREGEPLTIGRAWT